MKKRCDGERESTVVTEDDVPRLVGVEGMRVDVLKGRLPLRIADTTNNHHYHQHLQKPTLERWEKQRSRTRAHDATPWGTAFGTGPFA